MKETKTSDDVVQAVSEPDPAPRKPYEPPRVDKRRSLERVTLLSGTGQTGVGLISMMN